MEETMTKLCGQDAKVPPSLSKGMWTVWELMKQPWDPAWGPRPDDDI